jgi:hypothetical protein
MSVSKTFNLPLHAISWDHSITGSENACLPIIAATLPIQETWMRHHVPNLTDTLWMLELMCHLGAEMQAENHRPSAEILILRPHRKHGTVASFHLSHAGSFRAENPAIVPVPGGYKLGLRPTDLRSCAFEAMALLKKRQEHKSVNARFSGTGSYRNCQSHDSCRPRRRDVDRSTGLQAIENGRSLPFSFSTHLKEYVRKHFALKVPIYCRVRSSRVSPTACRTFIFGLLCGSPSEPTDGP